MWHLLPLEENITLSITTASQYWFSSHEPAKTRIETASYELRLRPRISAELNRVDEVLEYTRSTRPAQWRLTSLEKGAVLNRNLPLGLTHSVIANNSLGQCFGNWTATSRATATPTE